MASIRYNLTKFMFKHLVRPMMKKATRDPERFIEKQRTKREKKPLPLSKLHRKYEFKEEEACGTPYYIISGAADTGNAGSASTETDAAERGKGKERRLVLYFFGGGFVMPGNEGELRDRKSVV